MKLTPSAAALLALAIGAAPLFAQGDRTEDRKADHEALRELLREATEAMNTGQLARIAPKLLEPNFTLITVDHRKYTTVREFETYWQGLFSGPSALFRKIEVRPEADALTEFISPDIGVVHGSSNDTYHFQNGEVRTMRSLWTAVLKKDGATWKIVKVHFSASILDNPVLALAKGLIPKAGGIGALIGLLLGVLLTRIIYRRRTPP